MNEWLQFLSQQGARISDSAAPEVVEFSAAPANRQPLDTFVAPLTGLGLIALHGADAASFLHNQLTNDIEHLGLAEARLAGYCSPKGRLLATMLAWKSGDTILLQLPRALQPAIQKRLQMYVLRAKVTLADVTEDYAILGLAGASAAVLSHWFANLPAAVHAKVASEAGTLIRVSDADQAARYQWITPVDRAKKAWPVLSQAMTPVGPAVWRLSEIHAGIPQVTTATQDQFVPQMINFEAIGGVNFKKGCYPGQEIVARSQYLGKLKRRMLPASVSTQRAEAGMEIFSSTDPMQPCGMIVNAESNLQGGIDCLAELKLAALEAGTVHLGAADGQVLQFKQLPYALPEPA